tara:strand:+ start:2815 stop:5190 length:2376 start_codon:yes stop_codon:yes gene_type:complete
MMEDTSNIKTNFLGKDGFRWWIGQVPPAPNHKVNWNVNKNWGLKRRVRIMGYHPDEKKLPDKDLPLAIVLLPPTAGTGAKNQAQSIYIEPGEIVLGFFLDGDDAQVPAIIASFGRTKASSDAFAAYSGAFKPFTGYTSEIPKEKYEQNKAIKVDESHQETIDSQVSPVNTDANNAEKRNTVTVSNNIGKEITVPSACKDSSTTKVTATVNNFVSDFKRLSSMGEGQIGKIDQLIKDTSKNITTGVNGLVGDISQNVVGELTGQVQQGLQVLYKGVFNNVLALTQNPVAAHLAGVAAQKAMVGPVGAIQKDLECMVGNVAGGLAATTEKMLRSMMDSFDDVLGVPQCMADQFTGALLNNIVDSIGDTLAGPLGSISKVLSSGFDISSQIRSKVDMISGVGSLFDCGASIDKCTGISGAFKIGGGIANSALGGLDDVLGAANSFVQTAEGLESSLDLGLDIPNFNKSFSDPLGECFGGKRTGCGKPKVRIFGGNGFGAAGEAIMGNLSGELGLPDTTASLIGLRVTSPGIKYEFPPFVEIIDDCDEGYGAIGRALIKNGEVVGLYVVSEGEGYPPGELEDFGVVDTVVDNAGLGYSENDTAIDQFGNQYQLVIDKGSIVSVKPLNINITTLLPQITIQSDTGRGASIRPILGPPEPSAEIKQVIDCIDPEENNLVGYVKGQPYYGAYHIHPTRGVKMVGIAHTTSPHQIIYDTPEQSFGTAVSVASTMTVSPSPQTNVSNTTTETTTSSTTQTNTTNNTSQQTTGQSDPPSNNNDSGGSGSSGSGGSGYGGGY